MKKLRLSIPAIALALVMLLVGCTSATSTDGGASGNSTSSQEPVQIKVSDDKHVFYVRNYVGLNCANIGYTTIRGERLDDYDNGRYLQIIFVAPDGTYLDILDEDQEVLQQYKVSAQSVAPNTEVNCTYEIYSDGEESEYSVHVQSITQIVLAVDKVGENGNTADQTAIEPNTDQYACYVRDYTGRNLMACGYISAVGRLIDDYGCGCLVDMVIVPDDGSYVDPTDPDSLSQFYVTGQDIAPNTKIELTPATDSEGREYYSSLDYQSVESITLYVSRVS